MKQRKVISLCLTVAVVASLSLSGCQSNDSSGNTSKTETTTENSDNTDSKNDSKTEEVDVDTSWYENDGSAIASGFYVVGESLKAGSYTFSNTGNVAATVAIFKDYTHYEDYDYDLYEDTESTVEENLGQHSSYYTTLENGDSCAVNVSDGEVLMVNGDRGTLANNMDDDEKDTIVLNKGKTLPKGVYSSEQLDEGTYVVSYNKSDSKIIWCENNTDYEDYKYSMSKSTSDEDINMALAIYSDYDFKLSNNNYCMITMTKDSVLLVEDGPIYIQKVDMNWMK